MSADVHDDPPVRKVGYKNPPLATRFQPGRSGNSKGRPKGRLNLKHDLAQELAERITLRDGDRPQRISKQRAMVKSMVARAIKGDAHARNKAFELLLRAFGVDNEVAARDALSSQDEAILEAYLARKTREWIMNGPDDTQALLRALVRNDFVAFIEKCMPTLAPAVKLWRNWHIEALAYHLELCRLGKIRRLIITLPPRHLKSICASVAFPAWVLGHGPARRIVCVSYSAELAATHARDTRAIMESAWYREAFPGTRLSRTRAADMDFMTSKRGYRYATSIGGTLTGRGGDIVVIDDPMKAEDVFSEVQRARVIQWYRETLVTRLDDKSNDVIILVMQRLHVDDLAGVLLESEDWVHLNLPAIAMRDEAIAIGDGVVHHRKVGDLLHPEREPQEVLDRLRRDLGPRGYEAQYQQAPVAPDGAILRWTWFRYAAAEQERQPTDQIVQSWDTASKAGLTNDYSVCTTWLVRGDLYLLLDVFRARLEYPDLRRKAVAHATEWRADVVLIEDAGSGQALLQELERSRPVGATWWPEAIQPFGDKVARAEAVSVAIEGGQVYLIEGASYIPALRAEVINFPRGHDDQIDSMTQFLHWVRNRVVYATRIDVRWP